MTSTPLVDAVMRVLRRIRNTSSAPLADSVSWQEFRKAHETSYMEQAGWKRDSCSDEHAP